jgi:hypothetical protein
VAYARAGKSGDRGFRCDQGNESIHIAVGRRDRGKSGGGGGSLATPPHRVDGQMSKLTETAVGRNGPDPIGAGEKHRRPRAGAKLGVRHWLDPQQRHKQHLMTALAQQCRGPLAFRFRSGDEEAHALIRR